MDPESQAELPDETPPEPVEGPQAPARLDAQAPAPAEPPSHRDGAADQADPPAPLEHGELDAALPGWLLTPPRPALPPRKALALAELGEAVDGPTAEFVDPPMPDEESEVDVARLPAWMRGAPEPFGRLRAGSGPPKQQEAQATPSAGSGGTAQEDSSEELPEE